jgi:predicted component of type VI protein secretion system
MTKRSQTIYAFFIVALASAMVVFSGCGNKKSEALAPPPGPAAKSLDQLQFDYAPGAVKIGLIADNNLNLTSNVPAALSICLYQLSDLSWFKTNMSTAQGLSQLLDCASGPAGLVSAARYLIQPGQTQDLVIDRLAGTKYIAIAGGFSTLPAQGGAAYLLVPIHENKKWFFANTYETQELNACLLLKSQNLSFFPKLDSDLKFSAVDFKNTEPQGQPQTDKGQAVGGQSPQTQTPASSALQPNGTAAPGQAPAQAPIQAPSSAASQPSGTAVPGQAPVQAPAPSLPSGATVPGQAPVTAPSPPSGATFPGQAPIQVPAPSPASGAAVPGQAPVQAPAAPGMPSLPPNFTTGGKPTKSQ